MYIVAIGDVFRNVYKKVQVSPVFLIILIQSCVYCVV